jgi:hypothetical protein
LIWHIEQVKPAERLSRLQEGLKLESSLDELEVALLRHCIRDNGLPSYILHIHDWLYSKTSIDGVIEQMNNEHLGSTNAEQSDDADQDATRKLAAYRLEFSDRISALNQCVEELRQAMKAKLSPDFACKYTTVLDHYVDGLTVLQKVVMTLTEPVPTQ